MLKAGRLSDLRKLQQKAAKQSGNNETADASSVGAGKSTERGGAARGNTSRRRPHRFLPPRPGPVRSQRTETSAPASDAAPALVKSSPSASSDRHAPPALTDDDVALFRRVVESVTPSGGDDRVQLPPVPAATQAQLELRRQHAMGRPVKPAPTVSDQYTSAQLEQDSTSHLSPRHGPDLIKGLRRGRWTAHASLDLHGSTLDDARERLDRFIRSCRDHEIRCVRVVHGKGHGSQGGDPVLKETVRRWLSQIETVQAWVECDEANGGAGAVMALLEKNKS